MSVRAERALKALEGGVLAPSGAGYGVFPFGDRRRRPLVRLSDDEVRELEASGAITRDAACAGFVLTEAGKARARREHCSDAPFLAQHAPLGVVQIAHEGASRTLTRVGDDPLARLERLKDARGRAWFSHSEIAAARRLRADWEAGQLGLVRGSDWSAPPRGSTPRGPGGVQDMALGRAVDARRRVETALGELAAPMRRAVERVCFLEMGFAVLEREERWPEASAKVALKCALAQLAAIR